MIRRRFSARRLRRWLSGRLSLPRLLRLDDDDRDDLAWQARRRFDAGAYDEALRLFELLALLWPDQAREASLGRGVCCQRLGRWDDAERAYGQVLDADPDQLYALANRAEVRLLARRIDEARGDLDRARAVLDRDGAGAALRHRVEALDANARENAEVHGTERR